MHAQTSQWAMCLHALQMQHLVSDLHMLHVGHLSKQDIPIIAVIQSSHALGNHRYARLQDKAAQLANCLAEA